MLQAGWLASLFLALLICLAAAAPEVQQAKNNVLSRGRSTEIVAFFWMQRRERMIEQYAEAGASGCKV